MYNFCQQITIFNGAIFETSGLIHVYLLKTSERRGYKIKFGKILYSVFLLGTGTF